MNDNEKYTKILTEGVNYKRDGQYEKAKEKYIEAIKLDSKNPIAYYNLGKILYILGDYGASIRSYKTAFELGVDPYNVLIHLGHSLKDEEYKNGKWANTIFFYQKGINPAIIKEYMNDLEKLQKMMINQPSQDYLTEYEAICIKAAKKYLSI